MARPIRNRITPWIERLILSYGDREEHGGQLKAHVIGIGQMSQSQARDPDGPTGLLFLSDGVLHIPAVLTASAWERLMEQEDREYFSSLLNCTVFVQNYRLQFHMASQQAKCRFFLLVGELATTAAGPTKDKTPCCSTLPSVKKKICQSWNALLGQEGSQRSQCGLNLSELLGEWQNDCLQDVLNDILEKLVSQRSAQLTTSAHSLPLTRLSTSWDLDRVRYQGEAPFSVPVKYLCISEEQSQQLEGAAGSRTQAGSGSSVDGADWQLPAPSVVESVQDAGECSPVQVEDDLPQEDMTIKPLSNPWDIFPPPSITSSFSDSSPEATPTCPGTTSKSDPVAMATSTQLSVPSFLPPYQKQLSGSLPAISSNSALISPVDPPASDKSHTPATQQNPPAVNQDHQNLEGTAQVSYRKPKRKRCDVIMEVMEEEEVSRSPPSWLFETQMEAFRTDESSGPKQTTLRKIPSVHSDSRPFSYTYRVTGQNLQDFSRFRVAASVLNWAVKYLLGPRPAEALPDIS